tara:strand:- start:241 stop:732 length:492 start_codon:yes stop_codon:yes gene_type:complete
MKILVSKDFGSDKPSNDTIEEFMDATKTAFDKVTLFFDNGSHDTEGSHSEDDFSFIGLDFEERNEALNISVRSAVEKQCDAILFFNKQSFPKKQIVDKLFSPMEDENIFATISDYTIDDVLMVQNNPVVTCRRLEKTDNLFDLTKCQGIVKYIPLDLYHVTTN